MNNNSDNNNFFTNSRMLSELMAMGYSRVDAIAALRCESLERALNHLLSTTTGRNGSNDIVSRTIVVLAQGQQQPAAALPPQDGVSLAETAAAAEPSSRTVDATMPPQDTFNSSGPATATATSDKIAMLVDVAMQEAPNKTQEGSRCQCLAHGLLSMFDGPGDNLSSPCNSNCQRQVSTLQGLPAPTEKTQNGRLQWPAKGLVSMFDGPPEIVPKTQRQQGLPAPPSPQQGKLVEAPADSTAKAAPSPQTRMVGKWQEWERLDFLHLLQQHGRGNWTLISKYMPFRNSIQVKAHGQRLMKKLDSGMDIFEGLEEYLKDPAKFGKPPADDPIWNKVESGTSLAPPTDAETNGEQQEEKRPASGRPKRRCVLKRWPDQSAHAPKRPRVEASTHDPSSPPPAINVSNRSKLFAVNAPAARTTTTTPSKDLAMSKRSATPTRLDAAIAMNLLAKGGSATVSTATASIEDSVAATSTITTASAAAGKTASQPRKNGRFARKAAPIVQDNTVGAPATMATPPPTAACQTASTPRKNGSLAQQTASRPTSAQDHYDHSSVAQRPPQGQEIPAAKHTMDYQCMQLIKEYNQKYQGSSLNLVDLQSMDTILQLQSIRNSYQNAENDQVVLVQDSSQVLAWMKQQQLEIHQKLDIAGPKCQDTFSLLGQLGSEQAQELQEMLESDQLMDTTSMSPIQQWLFQQGLSFQKPVEATESGPPANFQEAELDEKDDTSMVAVSAGEDVSLEVSDNSQEEPLTTRPMDSLPVATVDVLSTSAEPEANHNSQDENPTSHSEETEQVLALPSGPTAKELNKKWQLIKQLRCPLSRLQVVPIIPFNELPDLADIMLAQQLVCGLRRISTFVIDDGERDDLMKNVLTYLYLRFAVRTGAVPQTSVERIPEEDSDCFVNLMNILGLSTEILILQKIVKYSSSGSRRSSRGSTSATQFVILQQGSLSKFFQEMMNPSPAVTIIKKLLQLNDAGTESDYMDMAKASSIREAAMKAGRDDMMQGDPADVSKKNARSRRSIRRAKTNS